MRHRLCRFLHRKTRNARSQPINEQGLKRYVLFLLGKVEEYSNWLGASHLHGLLVILAGLRKLQGVL